MKDIECNFCFESRKGGETCPRLGRRSVAGYESLISQTVRTWGGFKAALVGGIPKPGSPPWVEEEEGCLRQGSGFLSPHFLRSLCCGSTFISVVRVSCKSASRVPPTSALCSTVV